MIVSTAVYGEGPVPCDGAIFGQNPGYDEIMQGRPFVGASGRKLDEYLTAAGLNRSNLYVSNVVKAYTEGNREPTVAEQNEWQDFLFDELLKTGPKIVLALGNVAVRVLTGRSGIEKLRGKELYVRDALLGEDAQERKPIPVLAAPHPASGLRNPKYLAMLKDDIKLFAQRLGVSKPLPNLDYEVVREWDGSIIING